MRPYAPARRARTGLWPERLCQLAIEDFDRALANFDGAIAAEPSNAIGYLARSNFYARKGNADKQQRDYQQALSLIIQEIDARPLVRRR